MKKWKGVVVALCLLLLMAPAMGCEGERDAEKAGKKIDEAVDSARDKAKKLLE